MKRKVFLVLAATLMLSFSLMLTSCVMGGSVVRAFERADWTVVDGEVGGNRHITAINISLTDSGMFALTVFDSREDAQAAYDAIDLALMPAGVQVGIQGRMVWTGTDSAIEILNRSRWSFGFF